MRVGRNLVGGIGGSFWSAIVGIAAVPIYLHYLGIGAYGLIGVFVAMQAIFQSLDLGLAPTINREVARGQSTGNLTEARALLASLAMFYWIIGGLIAAGIAVTAPWLARHWLTSQTLPFKTVVDAVTLMGVCAGLRFPVGLYLNALQGAHRLAEASIISAGMATFGVVGASLIFVVGFASVEAFFLWQVVLAVLLVMTARHIAWHHVGAAPAGHSRFDPIRRVWRFTAGMSVVAVAGMLLGQLDKLVVSHAVMLEAFGNYTLAGLAARTISIFVTPVFGVTYPRLSALVADGSEENVRIAYQSGTLLLMAVLMPITVYTLVFTEPLFQLWTGSARIAEIVELPARLLIIGSALNAVMLFPYALQLAYGQARLPAMITVIQLIGFVPLLLWLVPRWGIVGGAAAWAILNLTYVPLGTVLTHRTILRGRGLAWFFGSVVVPALLALFIVGPLSYAARKSGYPVAGSLALGALLLPVASVAIVASSRSLRVSLVRYSARLWKRRRVVVIER